MALKKCYAILDGKEVKFVSDTLIVIELASDGEYTEVNGVSHEGTLDIQRQESGEWKLNWGYSSARRRGSYSSSYRNVSDSVATKLEKAIATIIKEWIPQCKKEIAEAGILSAQRSIETYERQKNRLLKQLQEIEDKITAEQAAIAQFETQVNSIQEVPQDEIQEDVRVQPEPQPKRTTFPKAAAQFYSKGYTLTRRGRSFSTAEGTKIFKRITDAIAWLNKQPACQIANYPRKLP